MPTGKNWINFIYVNLGFIAQVLAMYYFTSITEIKKNWPQYRCNPLYMPLSDDIKGDFTYCVQNTQINMMGYLLQPITFLLSNITSIGGEFQNDIQGVRDMLSGIRGFVTSIVENIFGVFSNLIIEFQMITMSIKDSVGKLIGIIVSLLYILDGSIKTMNSAWKGPPGQLVKAIGSVCFSGKTILQLQNKEFCEIKNLKVGDKLYDGTQVLGKLELFNKNNEKLYKIKADKQEIFVTGDHFVLNKKSNKYVKVKHFDKSEETNIIEDKYFNLITDNHTIPIENYIFWDWEDDVLTK